MKTRWNIISKYYYTNVIISVKPYGGEGGIMDTSTAGERAALLDSLNGIDIYQVKTDKFKTNTINIFLHDKLCSENASKNALVPAVLRRGCESYPSLQDIALHLEELYGASFDCGIVKKGESQIVHFYIEHVSDKYAGREEMLFDKCFSLLFEIMTRPVLENGAFRKDYVEQEKENLKRLIESRVNDKMQYAVEHCLELMCKDEPFGVYEYGSVQAVDAINPGDLYRHYVKMLETLPMSVYITGNISGESIRKMAEKLAQIRRTAIKKLDRPPVGKKVEKLNEISEKMNVTQGKLSMGFRTNIAADDPSYYPLLVYNGILGSGMHSKLFQNVREKNSLAYYVFSRLEKFKGLMIISSGIEMQNSEKAKAIILEQTEDIRKGKISDYEYESTLKTYETGMNSLRDSQLQIVDFYLSQAVAGTNDTFDDVISKMKKVTKEDVAAIAEKIQLDTVYFLTGNEGQQAG